MTQIFTLREFHLERLLPCDTKITRKSPQKKKSSTSPAKRVTIPASPVREESIASSSNNIRVPLVSAAGDSDSGQIIDAEHKKSIDELLSSDDDLGKREKKSSEN